LRKEIQKIEMAVRKWRRRKRFACIETGRGRPVGERSWSPKIGEKGDCLTDEVGGNSMHSKKRRKKVREKIQSVEL